METCLRTAYSSHRVCMICREKQKSLHLVNKRDIQYAYITHNIYIKYGSVICDAHWNDVRLIRKEEFFRIQTKEQNHDCKTINKFISD